MAASAPSAYEIARDVLEISSGAPTPAGPGAPAPWPDVISAAVGTALLALVGRGLRRARDWARMDRPTRQAIGLGGPAVLAVALLSLPGLVGAAIGRQATWAVLFASAPVPVTTTLAVAGALACLVLVRGGLLIARAWTS